jgi:hypothetical protein
MSTEPEHRRVSFDNQTDPVLLEVQGQVRDIWCLLNGKDGRLGLSQKVAIMWAAHLWVALASGGLAGSIITAFTLKCFGLLK